jgi:hypothetical protein
VQYGVAWTRAFMVLTHSVKWPLFILYALDTHEIQQAFA